MSAKLKELQAKLEAEQAAMEQELSSNGGSNGSRGKDTAIEVDMRPSGRTALDPEADEQAERKSLLRRKQREKAIETASLSPGKIAAIVGVGVVVALLLLLLLFSNSEGEMESTQPLTLTQLKRERPQDPCPDPWWIPAKCQGEDRIKSHTVWNMCQGFFDKYEYSIKYLKKCGIDIKQGKVPKVKKG